jgi:hypothetical protein
MIGLNLAKPLIEFLFGVLAGKAVLLLGRTDELLGTVPPTCFRSFPLTLLDLTLASPHSLLRLCSSYGIPRSEFRARIVLFSSFLISIRMERLKSVSSLL